MVQEEEPPAYPFTQKRRWNVDLHFMSGITLLPWLKILLTYWREIDWRTYGHRVLFLTFMGAVNSILALPDWLLHQRGIAQQQLHSQPVFILGHPRTGTTHLHNLLSLDPTFSYCSIFDAGFPSAFVSLNCRIIKWLLRPLLSKTRPMDAMPLGWELPAEDEIATTDLSGGASYYLPLVFPRAEPQLRPYLTLKSQDPDKFAAWRDAFLWFMQKVTYRDCVARPQHRGSKHEPRSLLIKSPVHVGRMHLWLKMFPQAKYIYIHRHPVEVFQSAAHMADTYYWYTYLQRPSNEDLTKFILLQYDILFEEYMQYKHAVPEGNLVEVSFHELEADPIGTLKRVYDTFGWEARFESLVPVFEAYCREGLKEFKRNQHNRLSPELEACVRRRWAASFKEFGYEQPTVKR